MTDPTTAARTRSGPRWRSVLAVTFGVLAVFGVLASVLSLWAREVLFEPASVRSAVEQALLDPEVNDALAAYLTEQVFTAVPVQALVQERLPASLDDVAPLLEGGLRTFVRDGLSRALADERFRDLVAEASERSHRALMEVLDGGSLVDGVTLEDDEVTVNLLPILGVGLSQLQGAGLLADVSLPVLTRGGDPAAQIAELEDALGRPLRSDFGQLVVYRSEQVGEAGTALARAQQAMVLFRRSIAVVLGLTVLSLLASVAFANGRRRALLFLALGVVAAMALGRALIRVAVDQVPTLAIQPGARAAARSIVSSLASGLLSLVSLALLVGLVLGLVAYLTGPDGPGRSARARAGGSVSGLRVALQAHRDLIAVAAPGSVVLVLFVSGFSLGPLLLVTVVALAAVALAWAPAGPGTATASGPGDPEPPGRT